MKRLAKTANLSSLALLLTASATAFAESAVSEVPTATLAMNSKSVAATQWTPPILVDSNNLASGAQIDLSKSMEKMSDKLNKHLEAKLAKDLEHAMQ